MEINPLICWALDDSSRKLLSFFDNHVKNKINKYELFKIFESEKEDSSVEFRNCVVNQRELLKDLKFEVANKSYLPEEAFSGVGHRMKAMSFHAEQRVDNFKELCRLKHREKDHGEDYSTEIATLEATMPTEDVEASTRIWWLD